MMNPDAMKNGQRTKTQKMALAALLAAVAVLLSPLSVPVGPSRCFPFQHAVNVVAGTMLGPYWALGSAFVASFARNALGTGTILAFPGSLFGALAVGFTARLLPGERRSMAAFAEPLATATIGAWTASLIISSGGAGNAAANALAPVFLLSSLPGSLIGWIILRVLGKKMISVKTPHMPQQPKL